MKIKHPEFDDIIYTVADDATWLAAGWEKTTGQKKDDTKEK